jgi:hypothetical protein
MSKAVILDTQKFRRTRASVTSYPITDIVDSKHDAKITYDMYSTDVKAKNYSIATIEDYPHHSKIESLLPFRVRFKNLGFLQYGPNNPAPIGIAVIGFSNYII